MRTGWLTFVSLVCLTLGFVQIGSERFRAPFYASLGMVLGSFVDAHRRSSRRIEVLEAAIRARSSGSATDGAPGRDR